MKIPIIRLGNRSRRSPSKPLTGLRIVVTMPPAHHWYGRDLALAKDHAIALRRLGAKVFTFDTAPFFRSDRVALRRQIRDVKNFRPDAVISAPHAISATAIRWCDESANKEVVGNNVFLDVLQLPTVLYWDHAVTQATYALPNQASGVEDSRGGVIGELRTLFNHPRAYHYFPDTGHIAEINRLGLGSFDANNHYTPGVPHEYLEYGKWLRWRNGSTTRVAFFGNLWLTAANSIRYAQAELMEIRRQTVAESLSDWDLSPFKVCLNAITSLSSESRARLRLDPDQTFYWLFLDHEITRVANGEPRLRKLLACGRPVAYFGGFADPESRQIAAKEGLVIERGLPADKSLAAAFRRTRVSIDVVTAPFINGFSHKLLACFASGGFMLTTRKADIASSLGDLSDAIGFSRGNELATKVEHYLGSDRERVELANQIADLVRRNYSTSSLFARTVPLALERIRMR